MHVWVPLAVFFAAYTVNMTYITVFYHRMLAHEAVRTGPVLRRLVLGSGQWLTGLDPAGWVCMHRMHHAFSDRLRDPHSPRNVGVLGVARAQLKSYERALVGLVRGESAYRRFVPETDIQVSALNRLRLWAFPYLVHAGVGVGLSVETGMTALGPAYFAGLMSHPIQGWLVNGFGHASGGRNFKTRDDSRNNLAIALLVFGEGLQNNHHAYPRSARFAYRWWEPDLGWAMCRLLATLRLLDVRPDGQLPTPRGNARGGRLRGAAGGFTNTGFDGGQ